MAMPEWIIEEAEGLAHQIEEAKIEQATEYAPEWADFDAITEKARQQCEHNHNMMVARIANRLYDENNVVTEAAAELNDWGIY